ncbi:MAG TPA: hypothetical protein VG937_17710 [Polyangiaceae bacterium]|nr:hypothetical protein [Polyangiaceae bacterium]
MARSIPHPNSVRPLGSGAALACFLLSLSHPARAEETDKPISQIGLDPAGPQVGALPGGTSPSFGVAPTKAGDWRFDFHGMLTAPLRVGLNTRDDPREGQSKNVLHTPPAVPDEPDSFSHTGVVPTPYTQLNFSYGNSIVTGTVSIVAKATSVSAGFLDPSMQRGINDAFLTLNLPNLGKDMLFRVNVGAFSNRYGAMGEYDEGRYATPLIARVNGVGENIQGSFKFGSLTLLVEQGIMASSNKPGGGMIPDTFNGFADQRVGSSFVNHVHLGANYKGLATLGGHYIHAWSQDERASPYQPDGKISVAAADLRLTLGRFGHLYAAYSHTQADDSLSVGRVIEVLNTAGGAGLDQNYLGTFNPGTLTGSLSHGTGELDTFGAQYDLSVGRLVSYPVPFYADGPDVVVSLFGISTGVKSDDPRNDGRHLLKFGAEGTYSLLPWLALSGRYDRVTPNTDDERYAFAVVSPRIILRTGWDAHDQVVLQYSHWFNGSLTTIREGDPPRDDVTRVPDEDMISLSGSMWW